MDDGILGLEDLGSNFKAGYKSWKKKYRKMRVSFEQKMHDGEELHKQEERTQKLIKRLALENDQLLDLLFEINNSPQIPPEKQIDVALPSSKPSLHDQDNGTDVSASIPKISAAKRLEDLLRDVPHTSYAATEDVKPPPKDEAFTDLQPSKGETYPASFFSPDDVDDAMYRYDHEMSILEPNSFPLLPTLAPIAHPEHHPHLTHHLKNPVSVTNWLRKNAPKIFLQDGDKAPDAPNPQADDDGDAHNHTPAAGTTKSSKSRPSKAADRLPSRDKDKDSRSTPSAAKPSNAGSASKRSASRPRPSAAAAASTPNSNTPAASSKDRKELTGASDMDEDGDAASSTPIVAKGKRKRDEDPGYRPKGGSSSRPSKKKRKSQGNGESPAVAGKKKEKETAEKTD